MGSGISYRNILIFSHLVFSSFLLIRPAESSGQPVLQNDQVSDTTQKSILKLKDNSGIPWEEEQKAPLFLSRPSNIKSTVIYDPDKNEYILYEKAGPLDIRTPVHMSPEEFRKYEYRRSMKEYWQ